jgi:3-dehydro-L-gulonate 2-dehydrogenase
MLRIAFPELLSTLEQAMHSLGLAGDRASLCARLFAETTRDGVYTHGLNRFPRFVATVKHGTVRVDAQPELVTAGGAIERWRGNRGVGNLNAHSSMTRAIALARQHGIGAVALAETNHWMRGGSYGWLAADQGLFAICWSNTGRNLPAWGTTSPTLGNNPLALAIPRSNPDGSFAGAPHVVLDTAMSQFSYGQLAAYAKRGEQLPVPGGFDSEGNLTQDAAAIEKSYRALPIGFWKGSGLALTLDLFAAALSGGNATHQITPDFVGETGLSQFFLAIDPGNLGSAAELNRIADDLISAIHNAPRSDPAKAPRYPGEETLRLRQENLRLGIPVEHEVWTLIGSLLPGS